MGGKKRGERRKERERERRGSEKDVPKLYTYNEYEHSVVRPTLSELTKII